MGEGGPAGATRAAPEPRAPAEAGGSSWAALARARADSVRDAQEDDEGPARPDRGDIVNHFAFGFCEVIRADGTREREEHETRSFLMHDLLHYAVEREAGLDIGFWGTLAAGTPMTENAELVIVEQIVGALHGLTKQRPAAEVAAGIRRYAEANGAPLPPWLTDEMIEGAQERMRQLRGHWNATPFGGVMELDWP